jgi:hypothetical protein
MLQAFWTTVPAAWMRPFEPVDLATLGQFTAIAAFSLAFAATLLSGLYFSRITNYQLPPANYSFLLLGILAWVLGGGALWLVGERTLPQLHFSADRFTLPLMLGSSLILAALLGFLRRYPRLQLTLLALLVGFSVGKHFQTSTVYRRDWATQRAFFWQMSWRIPALQPGTTILSNDLPLTVFSDNSLSGPLNWIYNSSWVTPSDALGGKTRDPGMNYILYFASVRTQEGRALDSGLEPGDAFEQDYLATTFYGNTSQMRWVNFAPPGCLRVLDPEIDPLNRLLPPDLREAAYLSNPSLIRDDNPVRLPDFYQPEIPRNSVLLLLAGRTGPPAARLADRGRTVRTVAVAGRPSQRPFRKLCLHRGPGAPGKIAKGPQPDPPGVPLLACLHAPAPVRALGTHRARNHPRRRTGLNDCRSARGAGVSVIAPVQNHCPVL